MYTDILKALLVTINGVKNHLDLLLDWDSLFLPDIGCRERRALGVKSATIEKPELCDL